MRTSGLEYWNPEKLGDMLVGLIIKETSYATRLWAGGFGCLRGLFVTVEYNPIPALWIPVHG